MYKRRKSAASKNTIAITGITADTTVTAAVAAATRKGSTATGGTMNGSRNLPPGSASPTSRKPR